MSRTALEESIRSSRGLNFVSNEEVMISFLNEICGGDQGMGVERSKKQGDCGSVDAVGV